MTDTLSCASSLHASVLCVQEGREAMQSFAEFQRITRELLDEMRAKGRRMVPLLIFRPQATL